MLDSRAAAASDAASHSGAAVGRLTDKVALVTGGGTGIGRACALLFAREGARVVVCGRRSEPPAAVAAEIAAAGGEALGLACDVTNERQIENAISATLKRFGKLQVLVNNAGAMLASRAEETSLEQWNQILATNLTGTFLTSRLAVPAMRTAGGGSIINIGSVLGLVGMPRRAAYAASKGGVTMLTKAMALDHASEGIRVNCICPALVETEMMQTVLATAPDREALLRARLAQLPLGRLGRPEDVAHLAAFLASDESAWLTGAALPLDGGLTAY